MSIPSQPATTPRPLQLETGRLLIKPLTCDELQCYAKADYSLEKGLGLHCHPRMVNGKVREALERTILPLLAAAGNDFVYSTFWTIIDKEKKIMMADLCFKGRPNAAGEVEIGYGTYPEFQGRGIMTEAVGAISRWALEQPGVRAVVAETEKGNVSSQRVLTNNGFTLFREAEGMYWWRLERGG